MVGSCSKTPQEATMATLKPGDKVYVKSWGYGNDPDSPAKIISIGKPHRRGNINISWHGSYATPQTAKRNGFLFQADELELIEAS
jgi:hypothetical protein